MGSRSTSGPEASGGAGEGLLQGRRLACTEPRRAGAADLESSSGRAGRARGRGRSASNAIGARGRNARSRLRRGVDSPSAVDATPTSACLWKWSSLIFLALACVISAGCAGFAVWAAGRQAWPCPTYAEACPGVHDLNWHIFTVAVAVSPQSAAVMAACLGATPAARVEYACQADVAMYPCLVLTDP